MTKLKLGRLRAEQRLRVSSLAVTAAAVGAIVVSLAGSAAAAPAIVIDPEDDTVANGITNLAATVDSTGDEAIFDVNFVFTTFNDLQAAGGAPIFDDSVPGTSSQEDWGEAVAESIADALNDYNDEFAPPFVSLVGPDSNDPIAEFSVPYEDGAGGDVEIAFGYYDSLGNFWDAQSLADAVDVEFMYASLTVVPEPGTVLLLGLGLAGMGTLRRRWLGPIPLH